LGGLANSTKKCLFLSHFFAYLVLQLFQQFCNHHLILRFLVPFLIFKTKFFLNRLAEKFAKSAIMTLNNTFLKIKIGIKTQNLMLANQFDDYK